MGHASALHGDSLFVFGGHTFDKGISDELFVLNLKTLEWIEYSTHNGVVPLAYMASTYIPEISMLAIFGGLT